MGYESSSSQTPFSHRQKTDNPRQHSASYLKYNGSRRLRHDGSKCIQILGCSRGFAYACCAKGEGRCKEAPHPPFILLKLRTLTYPLSLSLSLSTTPHYTTLYWAFKAHKQHIRLISLQAKAAEYMAAEEVAKLIRGKKSRGIKVRFLSFIMLHNKVSRSERFGIFFFFFANVQLFFFGISFGFQTIHKRRRQSLLLLEWIFCLQRRKGLIIYIYLTFGVSICRPLETLRKWQRWLMLVGGPRVRRRHVLRPCRRLWRLKQEVVVVPAREDCFFFSSSTPRFVLDGVFSLGKYVQ